MPGDGDISLHEHFESQIRWIDRYFQSKIDAINNDVNKAEIALSKRLEGMNEFRDTLKDQAAHLATRLEVSQQITAVDDRLKSLELLRSNVEGKAVVIAFIASFITSTITALIISYFVRG